jgi:hypothetical protein
MSSNPVKNVGHSLTHMSDWQAGGDVANTWDNLVHPPKPNLQSAGPQPTLADANTTASGQQLAHEKQMASTWDVLTGALGVQSAPAQTSSPTLVGM